MLIRGAELEGGGPVDVRLEGGRIAAIGTPLARRGMEPIVEARGGALLPGLHDHHVHLLALAAAEASLPCGPPSVRDEAALAATLRRAAADGRGWLRGVGYHESVAGPLDRERLDAWVRERPLRIQHRSGAAWLLNGAALAALGIADAADGAAGPSGLERDARGRPTGRLFRADAWLRERLAGSPPDLAAVGARLASFGVTGLTDATATNDAAALAHLARAVERGALPQSLRVMGEPALPAPDTPRVTRGEVKVLLDEPRLPDLDALCARVRAAHATARAVAIHCVTRTEVVFALAALREAGARPGDRLEHAAVAPPEAVAAAGALGVRVVTQPHFLRERGDAYAVDVAPEDLPWLYRARAWREAGVALGGGSDAPFGSPDPWAAMAAAVVRRSEGGVAFAASEALTPEEALALFTSPADAPGAPARRVAVGGVADLCLLDRPWRDARERLASAAVAATWCAGRLAFER